MDLLIAADVAPARRLVGDIADRVDDGHSLLALLGEELVDYEREAFATSGFGTWAPSIKGSGRTLVDTGDLLRFLTGRPDITGESVETKAPAYAGYLKAGARGMPKRDPSPQPDTAHVQRWAQSVLGFIVTGHR